MNGITQNCTTTISGATTTLSCYEPTDLYINFTIEFFIVALIIGLGIYLYKLNKK